MQVNRKFFLQRMQDNDETFIASLLGVIESIDELCSVEITKKPIAYHFRIASSVPKYNNMLIEEILKFCNMFQIRIDMSKSIKTSSIITFEINLIN
jgi:DNA-binding phage protein